MARVDVSVLICTYQRARLLGGALDALRGQRLPAGRSWEIVVVDNNSTDDTKDVVARFAESAPARVRYVFEPRQGHSHARNAALAEADGAVLAFMDDDVRPAEDWLSAALAALDREDVDIVGGRILPLWESTPPAWLEDNAELYDNLALMTYADRQRLVLPFAPVPRIWGANFVLRRRVVETVGLFDVNRGHVGTKLSGGDETDYIRRAIEQGLVAVYDPALSVHHLVPRDRMRRGYFRRWVYDYSEGKAATEPLPAGAPLFGAPRWMYRRALRDVARLLVAPRSLSRQLAVCWVLGQLNGYRKRARMSRAGKGPT